MRKMHRKQMVYGAMSAGLLLVLGWQLGEHLRVRRTAWAGIINRAKDISNTLAVILRSQRRFGSVITKEPLEAALQSLVKGGELRAIALFNEAGETVASAGEFPPADAPKAELSAFTTFGAPLVLTNLFDLGSGGSDFERTNPAIVLPRPSFNGTNRFSGFGPPSNGGPEHKGPPPPDDGRRPEGDPVQFHPPGETNATGDRPPSDGPGFRRRGRSPRPPWMNEAEYKELIQKKGIHRVALVISTTAAMELVRSDLWLRAGLAVLAAAASAGSGMAWRNLSKSAELQLRLVRASEMNAHLKELNLAAAGLAHETRNPLNIIRGLAQMILQQDELPGEIRERAGDIVEEADRVTAQLNEFIHYSKPREVRRSPIKLGPMLAEVLRTLGGDLEENHIEPSIEGPDLTIEADEQLLRQALFNLLLNAVQASPRGAQLRIVTSTGPGIGEAGVEIRDEGPGVPEDQRESIFKPYFTTKPKGTGLGLAVVQKIVQAHGWEIRCDSNQPKGAVFRLSRLRVAA